MNMVCKCGGKEFFTEEHGNQTGLYCSACGKCASGRIVKDTDKEVQRVRKLNEDTKRHTC